VLFPYGNAGSYLRHLFRICLYSLRRSLLLLENSSIVAQASSSFTSRLAKLSDQKALERLCKRAVGPHDYVLDLLRENIRKKRIFVVFSSRSEDELIGMSSFIPVLFDRSGWLGMARTDPDWRGKGVAQFLQRCIASHAKKKKINTLRCFVHIANAPSIRAATKGGFKPVAEVSHISLNLKTSALKRGRLSRDLARVELVESEPNLSEILEANYTKKMNGYLQYAWEFVRASRANLEYIKKRRELFSYEDSSFILVKLDSDYGEFSLLSGRAKATLLRVVKSAQRTKVRNLGAFLPYDPPIIKTARSLGFKQDAWARRGFLFEKAI
jgi:GNAT superfamily N-acetyltransferase